MCIILSLDLTKNVISCSFTMNVFFPLLPPPQWTKSISFAEQQFLKEPHAQMHGRFLQMPPNNGSILGNFPLILNLIRHRTVAHPVLSCLVSQTLCYLSSLPSLGTALAVSVIWVYIPVKRCSAVTLDTRLRQNFLRHVETTYKKIITISITASPIYTTFLCKTQNFRRK